jgi:cytosine deaminase
LVRQFNFARVIIGESRTFQGGIDWLRSLDIEVLDLDSLECVTLLTNYIQKNPAIWNEDIGED